MLQGLPASLLIGKLSKPFLSMADRLQNEWLFSDREAPRERVRSNRNP